MYKRKGVFNRIGVTIHMYLYENTLHLFVNMLKSYLGTSEKRSLNNLQIVQTVLLIILRE